MVGYPSHGHESQNYFSTKQHKVSKVSAGEAKSSPKSSKSSQQQKQSRPLGQHNGQNLNQLMAKVAQSPSGQKKSQASHGKHPLERQSSSPRTIPNKQPRHSPSSIRSSPSSPRSSPPRSTVSPSRSSPSNFASSTCYQPPTPSSLPKPPVAWTAPSCQMSLNSGPALTTADPTAHLKLLLNVRDITV